MPTGRNTFLRCRRCERSLHQPRIGGKLYVNQKAFELAPTGRTRVVEKYGYRHHVTLREYRCVAGHLFWSGH